MIKEVEVGTQWCAQFRDQGPYETIQANLFADRPIGAFNNVRTMEPIDAPLPDHPVDDSSRYRFVNALAASV